MVGAAKQKLYLHRLILHAASKEFVKLFPLDLKPGTEVVIEPTADAFETRALVLVFWLAYLNGTRPQAVDIHSGKSEKVTSKADVIAVGARSRFGRANGLKAVSVLGGGSLSDIVTAHVFGVFWLPDAEWFDRANPTPTRQQFAEYWKSQNQTKSKSKSSGDKKQDKKRVKLPKFNDFGGAVTHPLWDYELFVNESEVPADVGGANALPSLSKLVEAARHPSTEADIRAVINSSDSVTLSTCLPAVCLICHSLRLSILQRGCFLTDPLFDVMCCDVL